MIKSYISAQSVDFKSLDKLIGRLSFASTNIFGKFARSLAKPLYAKRHSAHFSDELDDDLVANLKWWLSALTCELSRSSGILPLFPRYVIYTDASWKSSTQWGGVADILIDRQCGRILEVLPSDDPIRVVKLFCNPPAIYASNSSLLSPPLPPGRTFLLALRSPLTLTTTPPPTA